MLMKLTTGSKASITTIEVYICVQGYVYDSYFTNFNFNILKLENLSQNDLTWIRWWWNIYFFKGSLWCSFSLLFPDQLLLVWKNIQASFFHVVFKSIFKIAMKFCFTSNLGCGELLKLAQ